MKCQIVLPLMIGAVAALAACAEPAPPVACKADALGVKRTIEVRPEGPNISTLLEPGEIVLTFDDGPDDGRTEKILALLGEECTQATFFLLGRQVRKHPETVRKIVAAGHTVGNHSFRHSYYTGMGLAAAMEDARQTSAEISGALDGAPVHLFRFPYVAMNPDLVAGIREEGMAVIHVDVDGADWTDISSEESADLIMARLEAQGRKGIVLLHDPFARSDQRTRLLLDRLKAEAYEVVAITVPDVQE